PLCNNQSTSIRSRIRALGWESRSSLTICCSSSVNCTRSQAMMHVLALRLHLDQHPCWNNTRSSRSPAARQCLSLERAGYNKTISIDIDPKSVKYDFNIAGAEPPRSRDNVGKMLD